MRQKRTYFIKLRSRRTTWLNHAQHTDLTYFYGEPVTVDWDIKRPAAKVKDQAYWDEFFDGALKQYGIALDWTEKILADKRTDSLLKEKTQMLQEQAKVARIRVAKKA